MFRRTYRVDVWLKLIVTVFALPSKLYPVDATTVLNVELSALPCTERVSVREPQPAGTCRTTWLIAVEEPRST